MSWRALFVLAALASTSTTAEDAAIALNTGDVVCVLYDETEQSCLTKGVIVEANDEILRYRELTLMSDYEPPLALETSSVLGRTGKRHCLIPGSITARASPSAHPSARLTEIMVVGMSEQFAKAGFCVEHIQCGPDRLSVTYLRGVHTPEHDSTARVFTAGDPAIPSLTVRPSTSDQINNAVSGDGRACLPTG